MFKTRFPIHVSCITDLICNMKKKPHKTQVNWSHPACCKIVILIFFLQQDILVWHGKAAKRNPKVGRINLDYVTVMSLENVPGIQNKEKCYETAQLTHMGHSGMTSMFPQCLDTNARN